MRNMSLSEQSLFAGSGCNVASCSTGCGEQLVQTQLAVKTAGLIANTPDPLHPGVPNDLRKLFLGNCITSFFLWIIITFVTSTIYCIIAFIF